MTSAEWSSKFIDVLKKMLFFYKNNPQITFDGSFNNILENFVGLYKVTTILHNQ